MHQRLLLAITLPLFLVAPATAQPPAVKELYHDFRTSKPVPDTFVLRGFNTDTEIKPEKEGLRFTLPAERGNHPIDEIYPTLRIAGDFEFTATYEILSYKRPLKGYGVGVNLTISTETEPKKFGKLCRSIKAKEGSVYVAETWPPKFKYITKKTEVMAGQLRLTRFGAALHYLVSDGPGKDFEEIWKVDDYGAEDLHFLGFQVMDSAEPNNPVDARLLDFRVRYGKLDLAKAATPAPLPDPVVAEKYAPPVQADNRSLSFYILIASVPIGFLFLLVLLVGVVYAVRQLKSQAPGDDKPRAMPTMVFACPLCHKKLKVRTESAGKKLKCPKCGEMIVAPTAAAQGN